MPADERQDCSPHSDGTSIPEAQKGAQGRDRGAGRGCYLPGPSIVSRHSASLTQRFLPPRRQAQHRPPHSLRPAKAARPREGTVLRPRRLLHLVLRRLSPLDHHRRHRNGRCHARRRHVPSLAWATQGRCLVSLSWCAGSSWCLYRSRNCPSHLLVLHQDLHGQGDLDVPQPVRGRWICKYSRWSP